MPDELTVAQINAAAAFATKSFFEHCRKEGVRNAPADQMVVLESLVVNVLLSIGGRAGLKNKSMLANFVVSMAENLVSGAEDRMKSLDKDEGFISSM